MCGRTWGLCQIPAATQGWSHRFWHCGRGTGDKRFFLVTWGCLGGGGFSVEKGHFALSLTFFCLGVPVLIPFNPSSPMLMPPEWSNPTSSRGFLRLRSHHSAPAQAQEIHRLSPVRCPPTRGYCGQRPCGRKSTKQYYTTWYISRESGARKGRDD